MTINQEVEILYLYIVEGNSMENVGNITGWTTAEVSDTVRYYGFNNDSSQRVGWQSGKDRGRYKRGSAASRGITVNRNMIRDFLQYIDDYDWNFENYIADIAAEAAENQRRQKQAEDNRRAQEAQRLQQQREWEIRQKQLEKQRREEEARLKHQEERNVSAYYRILDAGKKALKANNLQGALDNFYEARKLFDAYELQPLIAEVLAKSLNAEEHALSITRELSVYESYLRQNNQRLTTEQCLWYARAYAHMGQMDNAAYRFAQAADIEYCEKNYIMADAIYKEGFEKTERHSTGFSDYAFKLAFSRGRIPNITADDHRFCIECYEWALRENQHRAYARGNMAWHYNCLGDCKQAAWYAKSAIMDGNEQQYVYANYLEAQLSMGDYEGAYSTIVKMEELKYGYEPWQKADCLYWRENSDDKAKASAIALYRQQLAKTPNHLYSLEMLFCVCENETEAVSYGFEYLKYANPDSSRRKEVAELALKKADKTGNKTLIAKALEYNPEERLRRQQRELMEKQQAEQEALNERRRLAEEQRKAEEMRRAEDQRLKDEAMKKEQQKKEEEEMLMLLF